ncbi:hypothetical protein H920_08586 [Fukomys damarensis]|uniref:Uncharacterized protein n=1 Tax=Fukomys damarensis TaxID=885580 RepID=A0A091DHJ7_FUKDA|nr:hypothetical protein H920_08586 [Fukomys damarensis]
MRVTERLTQEASGGCLQNLGGRRQMAIRLLEPKHPSQGPGLVLMQSAASLYGKSEDLNWQTTEVCYSRKKELRTNV